MDSFREYINKVWKARYFWMHLARADLKYKFRRSKLGILWTFFNPLLLTLLMTAVFGVIFNTPVGEYAPYVLSGLVVWELIVSSSVASGSSLIVSEAYIRQFNHPIIIYPLKSLIVNIISFCIAFMALVSWTLFFNPENILLTIITLPLTLLIYIYVFFPITIISSFTNTKFRDYGQVMVLAMQALWYISPVFFKTDMLKSSPYLVKFLNINPVTHILNLIREPILYGRLPKPISYIVIIFVGTIFSIIAIKKVKNEEKEMIFYL